MTFENAKCVFSFNIFKELEKRTGSSFHLGDFVTFSYQANDSFIYYGLEDDDREEIVENLNYAKNENNEEDIKLYSNDLLLFDFLKEEFKDEKEILILVSW